MKNYKSLSVYKDRDVYVFGASGGGEIVKDFLECHDVPICAFVDSKMNVTLCYVLKRGIHPFILLIYLK